MQIENKRICYIILITKGNQSNEKHRQQRQDYNRSPLVKQEARLEVYKSMIAEGKEESYSEAIRTRLE